MTASGRGATNLAHPAGASPADTGQCPHFSIGLCLSGGGFRATFFHLGVIRYLWEHSLLKHVSVICAVSGGSIIAAHLTQNWNQYLRDEQSFQNMANELIALGQCDVRGRVIRRFLLGIILAVLSLGFFRLSRLNALQSHYHKLYRRGHLRDLVGNDDKETGRSSRPEVHLLSTSMRTGSLCAFTKDGFEVDSERHPLKLVSTGVPLSTAIAASSAFPPLFPPVRFTHHDLNVLLEEFPLREDYLTDGGVFDNLGLRRMRNLIRSRSQKLDFVVASDASAPFDWDMQSEFRIIFSRATRATDILMKRVADLEQEHISPVEGDGRPLFVRVPIQQHVTSTDSAFALDIEIQKTVGQLRTDLDRFSNEEIQALAHHGYAVAEKNIKAVRTNIDFGGMFKSESGSRTTWNLMPEHNKSIALPELSKLLGAGRKRRWRLWSYRDWASWALLFIFVGPFAGVYGFGYLTAVVQQPAAAQQGEIALVRTDVIPELEVTVGFDLIGQFQVSLYDVENDSSQLISEGSNLDNAVDRVSLDRTVDELIGKILVYYVIVGSPTKETSPYAVRVTGYQGKEVVGGAFHTGQMDGITIITGELPIRAP